GRTTFRRISFNRYIAAYFILGLWSIVNGLFIAGNQPDRVLGDFRRAFFYFMNYFIILLLSDDLEDSRNLRRTLCFGGVLVMLNGFLQMVTGQYYYRRYGDAAHILSHFQLTFLSFAIYYAVAQLLFNKQARRTVWIAVLVGGFVATAVGNYRAAWLG